MKHNSNSRTLWRRARTLSIISIFWKRDVNCAEVNNSKVDPRRNDEVGAPIRADGRRWKVVAGRQSAVFSFGRIARHPAVNPGRGDKPGDELVDATGSLVLIVRLLLVRVIPLSPFSGLSFSRRDPRPCSSLLPLCHSLVASSAAHLFSLASSGSFCLVRSLTAYSPVPGLRRHYRWRALNVFCLFHLSPAHAPVTRHERSRVSSSLSRSIQPDSRCCRFNVDFLPGGF